MATITLQGTSVTEDAYIEDANPTTNTGGATILVVGETDGGAAVFRSPLQFDFSSIPAGSTINSATLTLTLEAASSSYAANNRAMKVYRLLRNWVEAEVTWNVFSSGNSWSTAGAANTTTDREATDIGSVTILTSAADESEVAITLTASKIQEMISGGVFTNNGFLLQNDTETNDRHDFHSSETATGSKAPKLVIDYTPPSTGGNPMFFSTGGITIG